jgi:hypothetical protein
MDGRAFQHQDVTARLLFHVRRILSGTSLSSKPRGRNRLSIVPSQLLGQRLSDRDCSQPSESVPGKVRNGTPFARTYLAERKVAPTLAFLHPHGALGSVVEGSTPQAEEDGSHSPWKRSPASSISVGIAVFAMCLGLTFSYIGYIWALSLLNPSELFGSILFWGAALYMVFAFPLNRSVRNFAKALHTRLGAAVFASYLTVHLLLYGFVLDGIIAATFGASYLNVGISGLLVTTDTFLPPSLLSTLFDLSYNPSVLVTFKPIFSAELSAYSVAMALIIAMLVVANIGKTRELGRLGSSQRKATSFVVVPALGIVLGASCCLSVAGLISLYALPFATTAALQTSLPFYYATYFGLPLLAILVLYMNLRSVTGFASRLAIPKAHSEV